MSMTRDYRVNFRIQPSDTLDRELDRLATVLSHKYGEDVRIVLKTRRKRG